MSVKERGNFGQVRRNARRAIEQGVRELTREVRMEVARQTPRRTGRLARGWREEFRGMRGIVGNVAEHAPVVGLGRKDRPMSSRERRNVGFHVRGAGVALRKTGGIFQKVFRRAF